MDALKQVRSKAVPLLLDDVDTDVITPLPRILGGLATMVEYAFEALRYRSDGSLDPACVLNDARWKGAQILLAGRNFGCGSSRETAVWAIKGMGFRVVVAAGFSDIFRSNCFKNGVLPVTLPVEAVAALGNDARQADGEFEVDLEACSVVSPGGRRFGFEIGPMRREALLEGLDDLALTLRRRDALERFARDDAGRRPWMPPRADADQV